MYNIVARLQFRDAVDLLAVFGALGLALFGGEQAAMGNQPEKGAGEFHAGGERASGHDDRAALDGLQVFQVVRRQAGGLQVGRNRACAPFVSGQYHAGPLVVEHVPQVLFQELRAAAPHRELARGHADERADGRVVTAAARKGIQIDRIVRKLPHRVGPIGAVGVSPRQRTPSSK